MKRLTQPSAGLQSIYPPNALVGESLFPERSGYVRGIEDPEFSLHEVHTISQSDRRCVRAALNDLVKASTRGWRDDLLFNLLQVSGLQAGALAFVCAFMGLMGGLVLSAIKRDKGVKDWGKTISGHGGFIDRLDSVLFSAPVFFHLVRYGWDVS